MRQPRLPLPPCPPVTQDLVKRRGLDASMTGPRSPRRPARSGEDVCPVRMTWMRKHPPPLLSWQPICPNVTQRTQRILRSPPRTIQAHRRMLVAGCRGDEARNLPRACVSLWSQGERTLLLDCAAVCWTHSQDSCLMLRQCPTVSRVVGGKERSDMPLAPRTLQCHRRRRRQRGQSREHHPHVSRPRASQCPRDQQTNLDRSSRER